MFDSFHLLFRLKYSTFFYQKVDLQLLTRFFTILCKLHHCLLNYIVVGNRMFLEMQNFDFAQILSILP